jgi:hypothetical protein
MVPRAAIAALLLCGCVGSVTPVECGVDADCGVAAFCSQGTCIGGTRTCPTLTPTFSSINRNFLQVGCGVKQVNCHSSVSSGVESGPSFEGHPYGVLVNAAAANRFGSVKGLILVKPGDPAASFFLTKLRLTETTDPQFGSGQPATAPGSTCAESLVVIEQWIQRGAPDD